MDIPVTDKTDADIGGFLLAQNSLPNFLMPHCSANLKEEQLEADDYFAQEASSMEAVQMSGSKQTCTLTSGTYMGPGLKDLNGSVSVSSSSCLPVLSDLHGVEGAVKDLSAFLGSSYSSVFPDSLGSTILDMRSPEQLNAMTRHRPTAGLFQRPQNYQIKDMETPRDLLSQAPLRVVRPPGEGKGKNHMLPRYWPRVTEKELQLLTTQDSNSKITPLFEKVLSASDAGKVGRLVLPKACAEAYFPPIAQPEGVPLIVQDITGRDWVFQFRFWPNNNSRMYVLEGITPCIQSMNLQAGDTVIFSRLGPDRKLIMSYRRALNLLSAEENQKPVSAGSMVSACTRNISSGSPENISTIPSLTKLLMQTEESYIRAQGNKKLGQFNVRVTDKGYKLYNVEKSGCRTEEDSSNEHNVIEKRKAKDVLSKTKRQQVDAEKVEFRRNWEAAQNLLRSPPNATPSIVTIEGYDFEEYEEPPIFGKESMSITCPARTLGCEQEIHKERDMYFLQHSKAFRDVKDNVCLDITMKEDITPQSIKISQPCAGLETLASVATTEGNTSDSLVTSTTVTTKHPRHRPGCSCIVCIQPPSGQGPKHKPNCDCNVCSTVKRRFQTLMLRRKKLQSERAAEIAAQKGHLLMMDQSFAERKMFDSGFYQDGSWHRCMSNIYINTQSQSTEGFCNANRVPSEFSTITSYPVKGANSDYEQLVISKGTQLDLNSQPDREEELNRAGLPTSMKSLLRSAGYPLDTYLKEQGLKSLVCHDQEQEPLGNPTGDSIIPKEEELDYSLPAVVFTNSDGPSSSKL